MEEKVLGKYRLISELGSGGMATVYLGRVEEDRGELRCGERVAVKVLHSHLVTERSFFDRFRREAEVGSSIRHENVVRTFDWGIAGEDADENFLVMEYVEGQTLRQLLDELSRVPEDLCRHIGREIAKALIPIHEKGIIHRDLKPENVLITKDDVVKVMDLGVAFLADQAIRLSLTGQFVGSIFYAAPEQIQGGGKDIDLRVDLYQLGVLLYELASGVHPYRDEDLKVALRKLLVEEPRPLAEVNPQVSPFLEEVVHTLISRNRDLRFPTSRETLRVLIEGETSPWWTVRAEEIRATTKMPVRRIRIPRETSMYGRDDDLAKIHQVWERVKGGEGQAILVGGEAGIGKSRLLDEFHQSLLRRGEECHFLFGSYKTGDAATAAGAWSTAYREQFGADHIEETLKQYVTGAPLLIPALAALLLGELPPEGEEPLTKESIQTVFIDVTKSLSAERPTVVLIENLHLAHEEGRALFAAVTVALAEHRVLLVGTSRPGLPAEWVGTLERQEHFRQLTLGRLGEEDLRRLLADALGSSRLATALHRRIAVKSDGKPFYVFEILRGLREGQFIGELGDGTWVTTKAIREVHVPTSVRDLIIDRFVGLEDEHRRLLEMAACLGFEFDPGLLAKAMGIGRIPILKRLGLLEKSSRLVRSVGRRYAFDDHQLQEALYDGLPPETRVEHHFALGEAMEERTGAAETEPSELDGVLAVDLSTHFLKCGRPERARRYLEAALDHLRAGSLNAPAVELAELALTPEGLLEGEGRIRVLLRKAEHLDLLGWREEQRETLKEAVRLADELSDPLLRARTRGLLGDHFRAVSEYTRAQELLAEAAEQAQAVGGSEEEAAATGNLGLVFLRLGQYEEAREHQERALALAGELGDRHAEGIHRGNLGLVDFCLGRYEEARMHHEEFLTVARETGDRRHEGAHTGHLANVLWAQGQYAEALAQHERALEIARSIGDRKGEGIGYLSLGLLFPLIGRPDEGRKLLEEARAVFQQIGFRVGEAAALNGIGQIVQEAGRTEEAEALFGESLAVRREIGSRDGIAESLLSLGRLHGLQERQSAAVRDLMEAMSLGRESGWPQTTVLASAYLALLARGDADLAREALEENQALLCHHAKMEANLVLFKAAQEPAHLKAAHGYLLDLLEHAPAEWREPMRQNVPLHREILSATP